MSKTLHDNKAWLSHRVVVSALRSGLESPLYHCPWFVKVYFDLSDYDNAIFPEMP